ncbi:MAG: YggS family pyridoxal phosphate-dependent enzyme [Acidimicrobiales bacterium]
MIDLRQDVNCRNDLLDEARAAVPAVASRLQEIRRRIDAAGGDPDKIRIVGVTKTFGPSTALAAVAAGITELGENYADELLGKAQALEQLGIATVKWHFIGAVQRNKIPRIASVVSCWQTISRPAEALAISKRAPAGRRAVFIEVNVTGAANRPGCAFPDVLSLVDAVRHLGLEPLGLMAVSPRDGRPADIEKVFRRLAGLAGDLGLAELSMGMSDDLEPAVRAGATMLRIGKGLFGPRNPPTAA